MASNFSLLYVPGINDVDTPIFASLEYQRRFFNGKVVVTPIDGFYVPHYRDTIEISMDDLVSNGQYRAINYLAMTYLEKRYYYFVDGIEYISESVARLFIRMDTIQTYMFDVTFIQSHLTRESINRFKANDRYNRDYLRENFSAGKFILKSKKYYRVPSDFYLNPVDSDNEITGTLIIKAPHLSGYTYNSTTYLQNVEVTGLNNLFIYPYISNSMHYPYISGTGSYSYLMDNAYNRVAKELTNAVMAYYLPFVPFNINYHDSEDHPGHVEFDLPNGLRWGVDSQTNPLTDWAITIAGNAIIDILQYGDIITPFQIVKPTAGANFDIKYIPALLDDSYVKVTFGENTTNATIPLHMLEDDSITLYYIGDPMTGSRIYYIHPAHYVSSYTVTDRPLNRCISDPLGTAVIASTPITCDINVTEFNQYYSYNKASTWAAVGSAAVTIASVIAAML